MAETAWIQIQLPAGSEREGWDMVMAAAELLNTAVHGLDLSAFAEHLNESEARAAQSERDCAL